MDQIDQVVVISGKGFAGGTYFADSCTRNHTVRQGCASTDREVGVLNACNAGGQAGNHKTHHVDGTVLNQFKRQGDLV